MAADVRDSLKDWSTSEASNLPLGVTNVGPNLDDNIRMLQVVMRQECATRDSIASAATTDIGSKNAGTVLVTGTTGITSLGTVSVGIRKTVVFEGSLTMTNSAALALIGAADITTQAGDTAGFESVAAGWVMTWFQRKAGTALVATPEFLDGTEGTPGIRWASDTNTGFYRIGADNLGISLGGTKRVDLSTTAIISTVPVRTGEGTSLSAVGLQVGAADRGLWYDSGAGLLKLSFNSTSVLQCNGTTVTVPVALTVSGATTLQGATSVNGAFAFGSSAPTLSGGGTGPSITGTRNQARVTIGTGSPTTFTLTWPNTAANVTAHVMSDQAGITWTVTTGRSGGGLTDAYVQFSASAALTSGTICQVLASFGN